MNQEVEGVHVTVDGKEIDLNSFVRTLIGNTVVGMITSLRLDGIPRRIDVSVEVQSSQSSKKEA